MHYFQRRFACTFFLCFTIWMLPLSTASAITFGDTAIGGTQFLPPCSWQTVNTLAVTVDVPSRVFVNATAPFYGSGLPAKNGAYRVLLRDGADTTTLANIPQTSFYTQDTGYTTHTLSSVGVLFSGTNGTTAYTAAPGNYLLKFDVAIYGDCSGSGPIVDSSSLSYILLSSVLDRIFASGLNAFNLAPRDPLVDAAAPTFA